MTVKLDNASDPARGGRRRAAEIMTALEPVKLDGGRVHVELRGRSRLLRLEVRQFTPDWIAVEVAGGRLDPEFERGRFAATLDIVGSGGLVEQLRCEAEFGGWMAVSGRLDGERCGVARLLLDHDDHECAELIRCYRELRFPALFDRAALDAAQVAAMATRGGARECPSAAWCGAELPADLSVDAVYCSEDGALLGHASVTRGYSRTWIAHQLLVIEDHRESAACREALYNHFATVPVLIDGHQELYLIGYFDRSKPWHQLLFDSFVDWYAEHDKTTIVPFDRYEFAAGKRSKGEIGAELDAIELDQPRVGELEQAVALIREQLPPLACAAFDIEAVLLDRAYLHTDFASCGIARGRRVFVVREGGELVGVALCEVGSEELSLRNLFNLAQLYLRPRASSAAASALVEFVRRYYAALGARRSPMIVAPAGSLDDAGAAGLVLSETLGCIVWSGPTLRAYRTFLRTALERVRERAPVPEPAPYPQLDSLYLPRLVDARARLQTDARIAALRGGTLQTSELLGFLLQFAALGIRIVEGVEDCMIQTGQACAALGRQALAAELSAAANGEAERERLLLDDLFTLGERWRSEFGGWINVELLLHQPPPRSVLRLLELREELVAGRAPWTLLAVQHEIEATLAVLARVVIDACASALGEGAELSFLADELGRSLDTGAARIERLLTEEPRLAEALADAGGEALGAYLDFVGDCVDLGRELARRVLAPDRRTSAHTPSGPLRFAFA